MCGTYGLKKREELNVGEVISTDMVSLLNALNVERLVRRTDSAPVMMEDGTALEMRWGFMREGLGPVNNAKSERLDSPMWREPFELRRCVIPVAEFYEWSGPKGNKRTHLFTDPNGEWLWMAGLWEKSKEFGECFTMLTTAANAFMSPVHHRMPALLALGEVEAFLRGELKTFSPAIDSLSVKDARNPLLKSENDVDDGQGELF